MLIAIEGLDQSGKQTQARRLRARIAATGRKVRAASFPDYKTPVGQQIARALGGKRHVSADVMQLLYVANRFEHKPRIDAWLGAGDVVVCDRFRASSIAYGEAQGLDPAWLDEIQRHLPQPTLTILLDISPETAARRKTVGRDRYERDLSMLARVRRSYRRQAKSRTWLLIDGEQSPDEVAAAVARAVLPRLARPSARARS